MKRAEWIFRNHSSFPVGTLLILAVGAVISFFAGKLIWNIADNNAFLIVSEILFPAGTYYASVSKTDKPVKESNSTGVAYSGTFDDNKVEEPSKEDTDNNKVEPEDNSVAAVMGSVHSMEELKNYDFVMKHFYVVDSVTSLTEEILNLDKITKMDLSIEKKDDGPQILIFHTHSQEWFADTDKTGKTIVDAGNYLTELLTDKYGYNVLHITEEFDMKDGVLDRGKAYTYANQRIDELLAQYPSIEVIIDLHRDGVREDKHPVTEINGRQTAKIMLFNGISYTNEQGELDYISNPYRTENLALTYQMYLIGEKLYPDFIRCIYIQGYRYCLHHLPRSLLIEAGAQTNTFEEIYNAMEPLAEILAVQLGNK